MVSLDRLWSCSHGHCFSKYLLIEPVISVHAEGCSQYFGQLSATQPLYLGNCLQLNVSTSHTVVSYAQYSEKRNKHCSACTTNVRYFMIWLKYIMGLSCDLANGCWLCWVVNEMVNFKERTNLWLPSFTPKNVSPHSSLGLLKSRHCQTFVSLKVFACASFRS